MTRKRLIASAAAVAAVALAAAACGGSSQSAQGSASATPAASASGTVDMAPSGLGDILVDSSGRTLYLFEKDTNGVSSCTGGCASDWQPLEATGSPSAGAGVAGAKLGTTTRADGGAQVTYSGHPLYLFVGDAKAGDTKGEGINEFGAEWFAVSPGGSSVQKRTAVVSGY